MCRNLGFTPFELHTVFVAMASFLIEQRMILPEGKKLRYILRFPFNLVLGNAPSFDLLPVHELIRNLHQFISYPDVIEAKLAHFQRYNPRQNSYQEVDRTMA